MTWSLSFFHDFHHLQDNLLSSVGTHCVTLNFMPCWTPRTHHSFDLHRLSEYELHLLTFGQLTLKIHCCSWTLILNIDVKQKFILRFECPLAFTWERNSTIQRCYWISSGWWSVKRVFFFLMLSHKLWLSRLVLRSSTHRLLCER